MKIKIEKADELITAVRELNENVKVLNDNINRLIREMKFTNDR